MTDLWSLALSSGWSDPVWLNEAFPGNDPNLAGWRIIGVCATHEGSQKEAIGAGCGPMEETRARVWAEFLERVAVIEHLASSCRDLSAFPQSDRPERYQPALTNGAAIGPDWSAACRSGELEYREREAVLASWRGGRAPMPRTFPVELCVLQDRYEWRIYQLASPSAEVAMALAWPIQTEGQQRRPLIYGLGAAPRGQWSLAVTKAWRECLQRVGFLWDEIEASALPPLVPSAGFHQDVYLSRPGREAFERWLRGERVRNQVPAPPARPLEFVDLTPELWKAVVRVIKVRPAPGAELIFGDPEGRYNPTLSGREIDVHPIA